MGTALEKEWKRLLAKEEKMLLSAENKKETKLDGKIKEMRGKIEERIPAKLAIKGLNILRKYSGKGNTYDMAEAEFNNSLSVAEKRVFIVALHKLGIPILATSFTKFDIQCIHFEKNIIDRDEIK